MSKSLKIVKNHFYLVYIMYLIIELITYISRFLGDNIKNANANDTFNSVYSNELSVGDLVKKTFSEDLESKNNLQTDSMYSSLSTQSSLGILELENMSGNLNINLCYNYFFIILWTTYRYWKYIKKRNISYKY